MGEINPKTNKPYTLEEVKNELMVSPNCRDLNEYLTKFEMPVKVLQTSEQIERATFELYEDLAKQGVVYAEARFAPSKHLSKGLSYDEVVEASIRGLERAKKEYDIDGNIILCCMRGEGKENKNENIETVKVAKRFLGKGVCAIDLAGAEAIFPTKDFEDIFKMAKEENIPFTIHAGEADGPESIKKALEMGARRIGHGVTCIYDNALMQELKEKKIILEIAPISNLQTQAIKGEHPLEKIFKSGIKTAISSDNSTVSHTNILQDYEWVLENTKLTLASLFRMNINAYKNIFGTKEQKNRIISRVIDYLNRDRKQIKEEMDDSELGER